MYAIVMVVTMSVAVVILAVAVKIKHVADVADVVGVVVIAKTYATSPSFQARTSEISCSLGCCSLLLGLHPDLACLDRPVAIGSAVVGLEGTPCILTVVEASLASLPSFLIEYHHRSREGS